MLEGPKAGAVFPVELADEGFQPRPATLDRKGDVVPLEQPDPTANAELLAGTRFDCFE